MKLIITAVVTIVSFIGEVSSDSKPSDPEAKFAPKLKIYLLAGQSNMEGKGHIRHIKWLKANGEPDERPVFQRIHRKDKFSDVSRTYIRYKNRIGKLNVGWGSNKDLIGPEYAFGLYMSEACAGDVLLLKVSEGGKTLKTEFLPPSSGGPGRLYSEVVAMAKDARSNLKKYVPTYKGQGYSFEGLVWFQGFNDNIDKAQQAEGFKTYAGRLDHLIQDLRTDIGAPDLKMVIGQLGFNKSPTPFNKAQKSVADMRKNSASVRYAPIAGLSDPTVLKRFKNWQQHKELWGEVGSDRPYHYYGSFLHFFRFGRAFAEAMLDMTPRYTMSSIKRDLDEHTKPLQRAIQSKKYVAAHAICKGLQARLAKGEDFYPGDAQKSERLHEVVGYLKHELYRDIDRAIDALEQHENSGDVYMQKEIYTTSSKIYTGIDIYDEVAAPLAARFGDSDDRVLRKELLLGKKYHKMMEKLAKKRSKSRVKGLKSFAKANSESVYGRAAARAVEALAAKADARIGSAASYLR